MPHESELVVPRRREVWAYPFLETGRQAARLEKRIEPTTPGYDVRVSQSAENDRVTLTFVGGGDAPTVRINGVVQTLSDQREVSLEVPGGSTLALDAEYPASAAAPQEFYLYFDYDKPRAAGWSVAPPSAPYQGYLSNRTNPLDSRFETSTGRTEPAPDAATGADALRAWLRSTLGSPRRVTVDAHASFEGDDSKASLNEELTRRRAEAAVGIIGSDAQVTSWNAHGFTVARNAGRSGDPQDRYVVVRGASADGQSVTIRGSLTRALPTTGAGTGTTGTGTGTGTGTTGTGTGTGTGTTGTGTGTGTGTPALPTGTGTGTGTGSNSPLPGIPQTPPMGVKLAFRLQKIEQVEDKSVTLQYNRQSTERRSYAPQGLIGLLADDLDGPPHFLEVDLDSPFLRVLDIEVEAPMAFAQIGLLKTDVAIEYGRTSDPVGVKHKDISFRPSGARTEKASFFLNPRLDLNYALKLQYHFDPLSGWDGEKLSYDLPQVSSLDRTLLINPFKDFGFFEIRVVPGDLDPDMIDSTDVLLHYEHTGRWSRDKLITVKPGAAEQSWKMRLSDPEKRNFSYKLVHRLKDGTTRESGPIESDIPSVTVNDPFDEPLVIELFPNYDPAPVRLLIVDVAYEDPTSPKPRVQQIKFQPTDVDSRRVRFGRIDPTAGKHSIQLTVLGVDNSVRRLRPVASEDTVVFLGEHIGRETFSRNVR
jgi:hypothetical protein